MSDSRAAPASANSGDTANAAAARNGSFEGIMAALILFRILQSLDMKAYVMTTGAVFGLLTLAHIWRAIEEGSRIAAEPWYILITLAAAGLCLWAVRLLWRSPRS